ncbi:MAG: RNA polymerase-binding protein DksA [Woeseiaceae bacterium]
MAAKKAASKKRKKASASRKKAPSRKASRKTASTRKASKKKSASRKAASKKKASKKKSTSKKKTARKATVSRKKSSKKSSKKTSKKSAKKVSKKKPSKKRVSRKTSPSRKAKATRQQARKKKKVSKKKTAGKAPPRRKRTRSEVLSGPIHGIDPYKPKRGEEYMSPEQLEHFREILSNWKRELMFEVDRTVHHMQDEAANFPDPNDRATQESEFGLELRTRDRERKLLRKIDSALSRIDDGSYGYCEETGEEIGLKRLEARPVATLCLEAQERRELAERQFRDRDDRYR